MMLVESRSAHFTLSVRVVLTALSLGVLLIGHAGAAEPKVGSIAPDFELSSIQDQAVKLSALTAKGPVVLVVLRGYPGYQCPLCTEQVAELAGKVDRIRARGAHVVLVYPGPSAELKKHADEFLAGKGLPEGVDLLLDPDYKFTNSYGLRWDAPNETAYPSTFVVDRTGKVRFAKVSRSHGGRSSVAEILGALEKL